MAKLAPERVWWHAQCGAVIPSVDRPHACKCQTQDVREFEDLGYRVGHNSPTYSWYSTYDAALKDKRCK